MSEVNDDMARRALAARQHELLLALVAEGPVPEGFDHDRVSLQARALVAKRRLHEEKHVSTAGPLRKLARRLRQAS